jgi:hypothetical protein
MRPCLDLTCLDDFSTVPAAKHDDYVDLIWCTRSGT